MGGGAQRLGGHLSRILDAGNDRLHPQGNSAGNGTESGRRGESRVGWGTAASTAFSTSARWTVRDRWFPIPECGSPVRSSRETEITRACPLGREKPPAPSRKTSPGCSE